MVRIQWAILSLQVVQPRTVCIMPFSTTVKATHAKRVFRFLYVPDDKSANTIKDNKMKPATEVTVLSASRPQRCL